MKERSIERCSQDRCHWTLTSDQSFGTLHAEEDLLAFYEFPADHWRKLRSTNPLERVNREIGRRTDVVGIFPDDASLIRLATMLVIEQNDEWLVGRRYLSAGSMEPLLEERLHPNDAKEVKELQPA
jgi:transposase-like protein